MTTSNAWNPGLESNIPTRLWPLVTLFREENAFVSHSDASELADLTGLKVLELVSLRPERLLIHSLLVRVTADLSVQDGPNYEELGINLREMVETIHLKHIAPHVDSIVTVLDNEREKARIYIAEQLSLQFDQTNVQTPSDAEEASFLKALIVRLFKREVVPEEPNETQGSLEITAIECWKQQLLSADTSLHRACLTALIKTVSVITGHRGRMLPDHSLVTRVAVNQVCNTHGSDVIDDYIEDLWKQAVAAEKYRFLPAQSAPVIMNVKGASASGKSTIRPQQRRLSEKLGTPWEDFALISPDYWRKYLLDYTSLGEDYKYGAMLTGRELEMIDKKLDRYMANKASKGAMSHLLIDRFRFDSFSVDQPADSKLLSRFGDQVYLFFMVTHPAETVIRAFERGKKTGRYKAVDDLLHHNVEAFTGMPSLFLSWVNMKNKRIHFEFLDNDVPEGQLPKTAAFGWNETLVVLDVRLLLNIDRYRKVNISAKKPADIFSEADHDEQENTGFIMQCARTVTRIIFADQDTAQEYATLIGGKLVWWDSEYIGQHAHIEGLQEILAALGYSGQTCDRSSADFKTQIDIATEQMVTVGRWCNT